MVRRNEGDAATGKVDTGADTVAISDAATAVASTTSPATMEEPDDDLVVLEADARYPYTRSLGEGGMGEVRLCKDLHIGREVAVKVMRPEHGATSDLRARFLREARIQGRLEHPAIVPVYDLGRDATGNVFFTMKRVRGDTLEVVLERVRAGEPGKKRVHTRHDLLAAFARVCRAVDYAHARGVVHRDLKPANVMIGSFGEVYVLDWGIAKLVTEGRGPPDEEAAPPSQVLLPAGGQTSVGATLGTPRYMAPEQIRGDTDRVGRRTDVYALGAILFEILTLEALHHEVDTPVKLLALALEGVESRPSIRAPARQVPPELEAVCVRATAKDPTARYDSAGDLAAAVEVYLNGDRDLELRRSLASTHLVRARDAATRALRADGASDDRVIALREIGRAIALSPEEPEALALLVRLLTEPPRSAPAAVVEEVEQSRISSQRKMLVRASIMYACVAAMFGTVALANGVADPLVAAMPMLAWLMAAGVAIHAAKFSRSKRGFFHRVTFTGALAIAATSVLHGVLVVVPTVAAVNAMGYVLTTSRSNRIVVLTLNAAALIVPTVLVWLGVHPVHHLFDVERLEISGGPVSWPRHALLVLSFVNVAILILAGRFAGLYRDALTAAETRSALQAWQLRKLVPDAATDVLRDATET